MGALPCRVLDFHSMSLLLGLVCVQSVDVNLLYVRVDGMEEVQSRVLLLLGAVRFANAAMVTALPRIAPLIPRHLLPKPGLIPLSALQPVARPPRLLSVSLPRGRKLSVLKRLLAARLGGGCQPRDLFIGARTKISVLSRALLFCHQCL